MADSFRSTATSLIKYDENLWTYEGSLTVAYGIFRLPSRMTIIRLPETNHLVIISPFPPTDMIKNLLAQIGEVKYVVVPNKHHVFWSIAFLKEYPNSYLIATYGVKHDEKFNKYVDAYFTNDGLLYTNNNSTNKSFEWPFKQINYYCFYSVEFLDEVAFYHSSSSTLILTDLAFNISEIGENPIKAEGYLFRFYLWLVDGYRQSCVSKPFKYFFRKNIQSVLHDFDQLMNLYENFDRLIMAHGTAIHHKGYDTLKLGTYKFAADLYQEENRLKNASSNYTKWGLFVVAAISIYILSQFLSS